MADDAYASSRSTVKGVEGVDCTLQVFRAQRTEAFVDKECVDRKIRVEIAECKSQ